MKRLRKWLTIGAISVTALLAIVAQLSFTHPWDEWWINQATEISILEEEQETKLKGKQVEEFLSGYSFNYEKTMDFRCTRFVKKGKIRIVSNSTSKCTTRQHFKMYHPWRIVVIG